MNVPCLLVVNSGSSSLKLTLFKEEERLVDAHFKALHTEQPRLEVSSSEGTQNSVFKAPLDVREAMGVIFDALALDFSLVQAIGHRFVHGGAKYRSSIQIDSTALASLEELSGIAPLHNPSCLAGIKACLELFGEKVPQVAVFDTAFHSTMPAMAANYALPHALAKEHAIKRYGFHGISHAFLWETYQRHTGNKQARVVTAHLGNGCSMTAIAAGTSVDTSMGFTPAEGLVMATRAGDIDAAVVEYLCRHVKKTPAEVIQLLNFESGLLGLSGTSSKMEVLLNSYDESEFSRLAVDMFCYRVRKYFGAYLAALGGAEAFIFSGGIGENSSRIRTQVVEGLKGLGVELDAPTNAEAVGLLPGEVRKISAPSSPIALYVIATDENRMIAKELLNRIKSITF